MINFWNSLKKPIFCLAPMEDVTDFAFREMFAKYSGNPHPSRPFGAKRAGHLLPKGEGGNNFIMFTEFVNVDGLLHPEGYKKLSVDLKFSEIQRPIVAQIWGRDPEKFYQAAQLIVSLGFDGIDINFGCPQDKEVAQKTCAALIREPKLAQEIIRATKKGAHQLPVSVKTRLGYSKVDEIGDWLKHLLETECLAAVTIHARTKQEKSKVPAHWDQIKKAVEIRDEMFPLNPHPSPSPKGRGKEVGLRPLIIGNGDIKSREEGLARIKEIGCDGVMVARGAFGNPWIFRNNEAWNIKHEAETHPTVQEKLRVMLEHTQLFEETFKDAKSFAIMRKHFKAYASDFDGAHELRAKLMETENTLQVERVVKDFINSDPDLQIASG